MTSRQPKIAHYLGRDVKLAKIAVTKLEARTNL